MQGQSSGARASRWGHETAQAIARSIGAGDIKRSSNECRFNGMRAVIKCAAPATQSVGVTYRMLERLEIVIGAFQRDDGMFHLWSISPKDFEAAMRETRSQGGPAGKVGLVERRVFEQIGRSLGTVAITTAG
jgi:hypothetical protein